MKRITIIRTGTTVDGDAMTHVVAFHLSSGRTYRSGWRHELNHEENHGRVARRLYSMLADERDPNAEPTGRTSDRAGSLYWVWVG